MGTITANVERGAHLIGAYLDATVADLGLTQGEAHVLAQLIGRGSVSISVLHHEFGHKRSTLTNVLDRLENRGLVRRKANQKDRRSILIQLTPSGKRAAALVNDALNQLEKAITGQVEHRDLTGLTAVVQALEANVKPKGRSAAAQA